MNKNGFTLVELIAVIVLIALVSLLTFPSMRNLMKNNNEKEFTTYEDMMTQYTKTIPNYKNRTYVCLNELKIKKINNNINCNGYVIISENDLKPYLYCTKDNEKIYQTSGYSNEFEC